MRACVSSSQCLVNWTHQLWIVQTTRLISSSKRLECNLVVRRQRDCVYFRDVRHPDLGGWHVSSKNELSVVSADPARNILRRYSLSHGHHCKGIVARALLHEHNRIDFCIRCCLVLCVEYENVQEQVWSLYFTMHKSVIAKKALHRFEQ